MAAGSLDVAGGAGYRFRPMRMIRRPAVRFTLTAAVLCTAMGAFLRFGLRFSTLWAWLIAINGLTFLYYAYDKRIAGGTWSRVPEITLHGLAAGGGSPAALFAQWLLRHKTVKPAFQRVFWSIIGAQAVLAGVYIYLRS